MNDQGVKELRPIPHPTDHTAELIYTARNICTVTNLPFETPEVRKTLKGVLEEAITNRQTAIFLEADIDFLKELNEKYGKPAVNKAIREAIESKRQGIAGLENQVKFVVYRPQSGGDEYKILIIANNENPAHLNQIQEIMEKEENLLGDEQNPQPVVSSFGAGIVNFKGKESGGLALQMLEEAAEDKLVEMKMAKLDREIKSAVEAGKQISVDEYLRLVAKRFGPKRPGQKGLEVLLRHFEAKIIQRDFKANKYPTD